MIHYLGKPDTLEQLLGLFGHCVGGPGVQADASEISGEDDLPGGERWIDIVWPGGLHQSDLFSQFWKIGRTECPAEDGALADRGPEMASDDARQCALAAAVGTKHSRK